jgi:hypothetical protein
LKLPEKIKGAHLNTSIGTPDLSGSNTRCLHICRMNPAFHSDVASRKMERRSPNRHELAISCEPCRIGIRRSEGGNLVAKSKLDGEIHFTRRDSRVSSKF